MGMVGLRLIKFKGDVIKIIEKIKSFFFVLEIY